MDEIEEYKQYLISQGADPKEAEEYGLYLAEQKGGASTSAQGKDESLVDEAGQWIGDRVRNLGTVAESGLQSGLNMLSFGHAPEIQAHYGRAMEYATGSEVTPYAELRDYFRNRAEKKFEEAPIAGFLGGAAGLGAQIATMGPGAAITQTGARGVAQGVGRAATAGAGFGAAINPEVDGIEENLKARGKNALIGSALGVGGDALIRGGAKAWPYLAKLSSGTPTKASKTYAERAPEVEQMINKKYGYTEKIDDIHGKIKDKVAEQETLALGEFTQEAAARHPTTIGAEKVEGRINNIQAKLDEAKLAQETAFAQKQAAHEAQLSEVADQMATQRAEATRGYVSSERERLNSTLRNKLGSDDIDGAMVERMNQKTEELKQAFYEKKREVGAKIQEGVIESGKPINIKTVFDPIDAEIARLSNSQLAQTPAVAAEIESLVQMRESISKGLGETLDAESAFLLKDRLKLMSSAQNMQQSGMGSRFSGADTAIDKSMKNASLNAYRNLNKELDRVADSVGQRKEYGKLVEFEQILDKQFASPENLMKSLSDAGGSKKLFIRDSTKKIKEITDGKVDLTDDFAVISEYHNSFLPDEKLIPRQLTEQIDNFYSTQQSTIQDGLKKQFQTEAAPTMQARKVFDRNFSTPEKTQRTLLQSQQEGAHSSKKAVDEASAALGDDLNAQAKDIYNFNTLEEQIQNFRKNPVPVGPYSTKYMETKKIVDKGFSTPEKTFKTLSGYDKHNQKFQKQNVDEISKATGQNLERDADLLQAYRWFEDPGLLPVSSEGTTSTTMSHASSGIFEGLGGLFGEKMGHAGRAFGRVAGGPWAVKKGIQTQRALSPYLPAQQNAPILYTPWLKVDEDKNGR